MYFLGTQKAYLDLKLSGSVLLRVGLGQVLYPALWLARNAVPATSSDSPFSPWCKNDLLDA